MKKTPITEWPTSRIVIRLAARKRGASVVEIQAALEVTSPHTVRSIISRLNSSGLVSIECRTVRGTRRYFKTRL